MAKYGPHVEIPHAIAGSVSGRMIAVGGERDADVKESHVHVLQVAHWKPKAAIKVDGRVGALEFLHDDLLVIGVEGKLIGGDVGGEEAKRAFIVPIEGVITALSRDRMGKRLAVGSEDGKLRVYRLEVNDGSPWLKLLGE